MQGRAFLGRRLWRLTAVLAALIVTGALTLVFFEASPASAAAPYKPPAGVIDCTNPSYASTDACARLDTQPACNTNDAQCFFDESQAFPPGTKTWWIDLNDGVVCQGNDTACRQQSGAGSDTSWALDHTGPNPNIPADEVPGPIPPSVNPPGPNFVNQPGKNPQACAGNVNQFSTCAIGKLTGGLEFYALIFCIGGMLVSAVFWVIGAKGENPNQEYNGKRGVIVAVIAAFIVGAVPAVTIALNHDAKKADNTGITNPSLTPP